MVGKPRLLWHFKFQTPSARMDTYVDTDFAGCTRTRRSTSGGVIFRGGHLLKHWSKTQSTISLSSAESELTGICAGASQSLGMQALAKDFGFDWSLHLHSDAMAAIGVCRRKGLGKIRHLAVSDLWIQDKLRSGDFTLSKVLGADNPADILTKYVDRQCLEKHMVRMGLEVFAGRASIAPNLT